MYKGRARDWNPISRKNGKACEGVHMVRTECETLDEALDIIQARKAIKASKDGVARRAGKPPTLREELRGANSRANMLKMHGKVTLAAGMTSHITRGRLPKATPHPLKDLNPDQKRIKARELFASGCWGIGIFAAQRLAKAFRTTTGQMVTWLEIKE